MSSTPSPWKTLTGADAEQIYGNPAIRQWMEANGYSVGKYADLSKAPTQGSEQGEGTAGSADYMGVGKFLAEKGVSPQFFQSGGIQNYRVTDPGGNALASGTYDASDTSWFEKAVPVVIATMATAGIAGAAGAGAGAEAASIAPQVTAYEAALPQMVAGGAEAASIVPQVAAYEAALPGMVAGGAEAASIAPQVAAYEAALPGMVAGTTVGGAAAPIAGLGAAGAGAAGLGAAAPAVANSLMPALIGGGASLLGGALSANAAGKAADISAQAGRESLALQERIYNESIARQQPFLAGGTADYNRLRALSMGGPEAQRNALQMDPGYQFRLKEGLDKLQHAAGARGGLISGQTLKGTQQYAQDYASNEYGNVYNRLANLANIGPQAAGVMSGLGQNYAQQASGTIGQMGENQGNAALARGSAYQNAFGGISNMLGRYYAGGTFGGQPGKP